MSVAVAVSKGGTVALATDSQTNFGSERVPPENLADRKYLRIGDAYLACTGWTLYANILEDVLRRRRAVPRLDSEGRIFNFFNELWGLLHERYSFVNDQSEEGESSPFGSLDSSFIVVCSKGLYSVSSDLSVTRFERYFAIGSGAHVAMGALHALYDEPLEAEAVAERAAQAAIAHDIYCGPPINRVAVRAVRPRARKG